MDFPIGHLAAFRALSSEQHGKPGLAQAPRPVDESQVTLFEPFAQNRLARRHGELCQGLPTNRLPCQNVQAIPFSNRPAPAFRFSACPKFQGFQVMRSLFRLHWFEIQKENCLTLAIIPRAIGHPHELRACPRRSIRAKSNGIAEKLVHLVVRLAVDIKPTVK